MIRELVSYYDRLVAGDAPDLPLMGYSRQKISFCIVLKPNGALHSFAPEEVQEGNRTFAKVMTVPGQSKPPGTALNPGFLWDNLAYMLGYKVDDPKPERTSQAFEAFRNRHLAVEGQIDDPAYTAFCRFLRDWAPGNAADHPKLSTMAAGFGVVKLVGETEYLHERPAVRTWWEAHGAATVGDAGESMTAPSLTDGKSHPIARLHKPQIKGVVGGDPKGALLVSFNQNAFESYGKTQSFNAPVSVADAFKYCTVLNRLTTDRDRRVVLGDTTVVYWSERPTELESVFAYLCEPAAPEDPETQQRLGRFFDRVMRLAPAGEMSEDGVPFYVLGLAPNGPRISVRYWMKGTVRTFAERLGRHFDDMQIGERGSPSEEEATSVVNPPTLQRLLDSTARDRKQVSPLLAGALLRAVLSGSPYPQNLLAAILQRVSAEGDISFVQACVLKATLRRNWRTHMDSYLDKIHPEPAYHCGRLTATLAFIQSKALGAVNSGVVRRNLGSLMAAPGLHLGRLQKAAEVGHIPKLEGDLPVFAADELGSINGQFRGDLPRALNMRQQGIFMLGFYQQMQYLRFVSALIFGFDRKVARERSRLRTARGEWVRSRYEVWVANALSRLNLPYFYEVGARLPIVGMRWPDFFLGLGKNPADHVYIEVLGLEDAKYEERWKLKMEGYRQFGATTEGGPNGRLVVLDFRDKKYDEVQVINALQNVFPTINDN